MIYELILWLTRPGLPDLGGNCPNCQTSCQHHIFLSLCSSSVCNWDNISDSPKSSDPQLWWPHEAERNYFFLHLEVTDLRWTAAFCVEMCCSGQMFWTVKSGDSTLTLPSAPTCPSLTVHQTNNSKHQQNYDIRHDHLKFKSHMSNPRPTARMWPATSVFAAYQSFLCVFFGKCIKMSGEIYLHFSCFIYYLYFFSFLGILM